MLLQAQAEVGGRLGLDPVELNRLAGEWQPKGHAIEVRVYAENPADDHKPAPGLFTDVAFPDGNGIRVDTWLERGSWVTPFFGKILQFQVALEDRYLFPPIPPSCESDDVCGHSWRSPFTDGDSPS